MTITEFLAARLGEDEERASSGWSSLRDERWMTTNEGLSILTPSAVLADIAAKRAILALHDDELADEVESGDASAYGADLMHRMVISALAQPYAEHPDYDPAWRTA